jgi:transketolase
MRTAFIEELIRQAQTNPNIFLVVGDLGYSVVEPFAREFPDRFLNAGVAEQNMTGVAAGLASEGYHVFTYSIANFPTFRCAEQIRNDIAYHGLSVTVVAVGGGLAYGSLGYSHHAVQDLALMRMFPGLLLACPGDPAETQACVRFLSAHPRPSYLRLGKGGEARVRSGDVGLCPGDILSLREGAGVRCALLTTTAVLKLAVDASLAPELAQAWDVASLPLWNQECVQTTLPAWLAKYDRVVTVEDHLAAGGFASFVRECLADTPALGARVRGLSLSADVCGMVGTQTALNFAGGLSVPNLIAVMNAWAAA